MEPVSEDINERYHPLGGDLGTPRRDAAPAQSAAAASDVTRRRAWRAGT